MLQYVTMPMDILELPNLSINEKFILSLAKTLNQGCFLSNQQISSMLGISKSRVSHIISKLVKDGLLDITLEYKPNSKEVEKRTITLKAIVEKVKEVVQNAKNKARELKKDYVQESVKVGTENVSQVKFGVNMYKQKKTKFNTTYSHNFDLDELERKERQHIDNTIKQLEPLEDIMKRYGRT